MSKPKEWWERDNPRYETIIDAYIIALAGRDPASISIFDLLPAIFEAVPDTSQEEIADALTWKAKRCIAEADELKRYRNAKFGNKGKAPNESTIPFRRPR
jgi:hypothetical protein